MDALSSQANVAGYKAALLAADTYGNYLPMFVTAAGTTRPALVLVIGAGVAGLQAIGTARRLGAVVTGYDVRDAGPAVTCCPPARPSWTWACSCPRSVRVGTPGSSPSRSGAPAGRADDRHRPVRHRHHHRPGSGSTATAAGVGHRAGRDASRIGGHRPRIQRPGRQRRGLQARPARRHRKRRDPGRGGPPSCTRVSRSPPTGNEPGAATSAGPPRPGPWRRRARPGVRQRGMQGDTSRQPPSAPAHARELSRHRSAQSRQEGRPAIPRQRPQEHTGPGPHRSPDPYPAHLSVDTPCRTGAFVPVPTARA